MIIGAVYPHISKAIGGFSFLIFGTIIIISSIFVHYCVPETRGKTISEVQKYFLDNTDGSNETKPVESGENSSRDSGIIDEFP